SDRRAKSTISWLVQNGINANRLTGKGYGESQLVNKCTDNVKCTEEEHQMNRRSEFIITDL
ncbi:OmpA family protein, partial [Flavobacterium flevense]